MNNNSLSFIHISLDSDSPLDIFTRHLCDILGAISDPDTERLPNDLSSAYLIPYSVKDDLISTKGLSRYQKASILMNEIDRLFRQANQPEMLKIFCTVLKKQENQVLTRIAEDMLTELGIPLMIINTKHNQKLLLIEVLRGSN